MFITDNSITNKNKYKNKLSLKSDELDYIHDITDIMLDIYLNKKHQYSQLKPLFTGVTVYISKIYSNQNDIDSSKISDLKKAEIFT